MSQLFEHLRSQRHREVFDLVLDKEECIYTGGDDVFGSIKFTSFIDNPPPVIISFKGFESVYVPPGHEMKHEFQKRRHFMQAKKEEIDVVPNLTELAANGSKKSVYFYPFKLTLSPAAQASFKYGSEPLGQVGYLITASIKLNDFRQTEHHVEEEILVVGPSNTNQLLNNTEEPSMSTTDKGITIDAKLDSKYYQPGDNCNVNLKIANNGKRPVTHVKLELRARYFFDRSAGKKAKKFTTLRVVSYRVPCKVNAGGTYNGVASVGIPLWVSVTQKDAKRQALPPTVVGRMITFEYCVRVTADVAWFPDTKIDVPIQIIPLTYDISHDPFHSIIKGEYTAPYRLSVQLVEARHLLSKDLNGFSDPYCVLQYRDGVRYRQHKSQVVKKSLYPEWNETYEFDVDTTNPKGGITLLCLDWDQFSNDDMIGDCFLYWNLLQHAGLTESTPLDRWFALRPKSEGNIIQAGEVRLIIELKALTPTRNRKFGAGVQSISSARLTTPVMFGSTTTLKDRSSRIVRRERSDDTNDDLSNDSATDAAV
eukprot:TRINITY_DN6244_c0_g1_i1.p1 TRINITY_DN6244_c0_g1~~TRINITY_DN6244_c0_g1_i1.p1  ORF type:complete len:537 (-),score=111.02 TRINITY_DN6244_c0_g1_i1:68-1678(-)